MVKARNNVPVEVLKEIFPRKLSSCLGSDYVYTQLKRMILSGKLKKGKRLSKEEIALNFDVGEGVARRAFSQLKKDGLVISKGKKGSFVA